MELPLLVKDNSLSRRSNNLPSLLYRNRSEDLSTSIIPIIDNIDTRRKRKKQEILSLSKHNKVEEVHNKKFEDYKIEINNIMSGYKIETEKTLKEKKEKELEKERDKSFGGSSEESKIIKQNIKKNVSHNSSRLIDNIQINIEYEEFTDPLHSLNILENNRNIYDKINDKNSNRQKAIYKNLIDTVTNKPIDLKKIKVTSILPKTDVVSLNSNKTESKNFTYLVNSQQLMGINSRYSGNLEFYAYYMYSKTNFPESREQFSLNHNPFYVILFGGISSKSFSDSWILDPIKVAWKKVIYENSPPNPRFGHSATLYQKKLIIFGGKTKFNNYSINSDIEILNISEKIWEYPILNTKSLLKTRRNHAAELINNQILFHGGLSDENIVLNDFQVFNINPYKWISFSILEGSTIPALYGHTATMVLPADLRNHPKLNIFKLPEDKIQRRNFNNIKEKGIYLFGGKSHDNLLSNDIYLVKVGKKPLEISKLDTIGKPPTPRYFHSANFYEAGNFFIIYGGRNDMNDDYALGDLYILELSRLEWIEVSIYSDEKINVYPRCGHSSIIVNNKLIVFGGMNSNNYIGSSLFFIELDISPTKKDQILKKKKLELIFGKDTKKDNQTKEKKKNIIYKLFLPPIK